MVRPEPLVAGIGYWVIPEAQVMRRVEAFVDPNNPASMRALEGSGFQKEGLLRSYLMGTQDVFIYSLLPSDLE